ncbi:hypothetical protein SNEBB_002619 [Seison nebaliae]|nr:hypothetical protein SNEBB_002619 [Seison nebaliae]
MSLKGLKVLELMGLAPVPMCGKLLLDHGAKVTRIVNSSTIDLDVLSHGKRSINLNLKDKKDQLKFFDLIKISDILLNGNRPNVLNKLNCGEHKLRSMNSRLIIASINAFGILSKFPLDETDPQHIHHNSTPLMIADFFGGSLLAFNAILLALLKREKNEVGEHIDCSMTKGTSYTCGWLYHSRNEMYWNKTPGHNMLDGGCHYYTTYRTKDKRFMAVGCLEQKQFSVLANEKEKKKIISQIFSTKTRKEWTNIFTPYGLEEDKNNKVTFKSHMSNWYDACVTPILEMSEIAPQNFIHSPFT